MNRMPIEPDPKIPLVTPMTNRDATSLFDARMVNCFAEIEGERLLAVKRSGLSFSFLGNVGAGQGLYNFLENLYSVSNDVLNINQTFTAGFTQASSGAGPTPRKGMMVAGFQGKLWQMGGEFTDSSGFTTRYSDAFFSLDGVNWTQATVPWAARSFGQAVVFNGELFVMGGIAANGSVLGDVWVTSDGTNWSEANTSAWPGRAEFGVTQLNGKLFVAGGRTMITDQQGLPAGYYNDVWSSSDGASWTRVLANGPWLPRARFGFVGFKGKLRIIGGELSGYWQGAVPDSWSSLDGATWTRDSSNPFGQGGSSVFSRIVLTSFGANFEIAPFSVGFSGGGGSGATGSISILDEDEMDADTGGLANMVTVTNGGSGYTSAPSVTFTTGGGNALSGYALLTSLGASGDKRGDIVISNSGALYFFGWENGGALSGDVWTSADGLTWTQVLALGQFGARDSNVLAYGNLWVFGGQTSSGYMNDVWKGQLSPSNSLSLSPSQTGLMMTFSQTSATIASPLLFFKSTADAYSYNPATNLITVVSGHGSFPSATVPGIVYLDGTFYVMDTQGRVYGSAINDPTSWSSLNEIAEQNEPNNGTGIAKYRSYVVAFGVWSTTFFYDAAVAAPASPLLPDNTLTRIIGCASGNSIVEMVESVVWIGQSRREGRAVYMLNDYSPVPISTPFINRILQADDLSNVRAYATEVSGHSMYVLTLVSSNITLVYDFTTQLWCVWTSRQPAGTFAITSLVSDAYGYVTATAPSHNLQDGDPVVVSGSQLAAYNGTFNAQVVDGNTFKYVLTSVPSGPGGTAQGIITSEGYFYGIAAAQLKGVNYVQHERNGIVFQLLPGSFNDYGNPIDVRVTTGKWNGGSSSTRKFLAWATLNSDNVDASALVRYTDDDYESWSTYRPIDLSNPRHRLSNLGSFYNRAFQVRHTSSTRFRAEALELSVAGGS